MDGEFKGVLHSDIYIRSGLKVGDEVQEPALEDMLRDSEQLIAREKAIKLLSGRAYTAQGLYEKLVERVGENAATSAVSRMIEIGLLDDRDYARRYTADGLNIRGHSHSRIARELRQKGIEHKIIDEVIGGFEEDAETLIARLAIKKYRRYLQTEAGRKKTIDSMIRRGFHYGDIRKVIDNLCEDPNYYESWPDEETPR